MRLGDAVDCWTVVGIELGRRLTLDFGLEAPGAGMREFSVQPSGPGRMRIDGNSSGHPQGVGGRLYWAGLAPCQHFIFKGMTRTIARRAENLTAWWPTQWPTK